MLVNLVVATAVALRSIGVISRAWMSDFLGKAEWWDAWQAFGTVGATVVAVVLGLAGSVQGRKAQAALKEERAERASAERLAAASLVSAWIESEYIGSDQGRQYRRQDILYAANESNEPVFDVHILVGADHPRVQVGPLAAPETIPVLPARSKRSWDISLGLLAHLGPYQLPAAPVASVDFIDSRDARWSRDFDGRLKEITSEQPPVQLTKEEGERQLGDQNFFNPIWKAITFLNILRDHDEPVTTTALTPLFAQHAPGLAEMSDSEWQRMAKELEDYGTGTHVWYPAPHVAYVRLVPASGGVYRVNVGEQVRGVWFLTLVFYAGTGWHIFGVGERVVAPDWILFPPGGIHENARGPLPKDE
jgi:hypothetical protein